MSLFDRFFPKSQSSILHITSQNGFHLRPAARFAAEAKKFNASIEAETRGKSVNAKQVNALLSLNLEQGDHFELTCKGKDAKEAIEQLEAFFHILMEDDRENESIKKEETAYESPVIDAEIISRGVVIAPAFRYKEETVKKECDLNFSEALAKSLEELETLFETHKANEDAAIYLAQKELLSAIAKDVDSLEEFELTIEEESARLVGSKMAAKITDYKDILQRMRKQMGIETEMILPETPSILLAEELLPSQIERLKESNAEGVVLKETTLTSHTAILLRGSGIPSLIADYSPLKEGSGIIMDANSGLIVMEPTTKDIQKAKERQKDDQAQKDIASQKRFEKALTRTQKQIRVFANVIDAVSAKIAKEEGAEGIGLLRTEFLFKEKQPTLEEQADAYREIFELFDEITVRTLDVGGDKKLPYLSLPHEENPFLGIRGIRLYKTHPQLMEEQLHAIFLAANGRPLKVMFPMVSTVEEFMEAKEFALQTAKKHNIDVSAIHFGIMVEVPSVLFLIKEFNKVVDFYSIGSNDLTQYLFAMERTHPSLKVDEHSPVVYDAIRTVVKQADKPVSICGELAAEPEAIGKLLKIGIETLSVSPKSIAATKEEIRHV
ncbi:HPr family phosphocarrier protein [Sulfurovum sp. NBC37-1]|uniref:HPr family phosphocarrier protein n=1 Tax=Sulfurovum sp. (strain NBC37-1) TaxID=387093 RepID=UPI0001587D3E|nr:HPr family phosphocarrier protein [Sulfurovum sp. NBC37-1]BAF73178.1 PTS system, EI component, phosphoenolpyruvate-protein kinase [Sulfurovum sp. NBC37-1]